MKMPTITALMGKSILVHLGQPLLIPLVKETINMIKNGMKTNRIAQMMMMKNISATHAKMNIPKNAILLPTFA